MANSHNEILEADFELGFTYSRSPGIIIGKFLAALKQKQLYGIRGSDGSVLFPPTEYDPRNSAALDDFVPLKATGKLLYWTWIEEPRAHHNIDQPFAFGMVQLDGADIPFLHRVFANDAALLSSGMSVEVQWAAETVGAITDIHGFVAVTEATTAGGES